MVVWLVLHPCRLVLHRVAMQILLSHLYDMDIWAVSTLKKKTHIYNAISHAVHTLEKTRGCSSLLQPGRGTSRFCDNFMSNVERIRDFLPTEESFKQYSGV